MVSNKFIITKIKCWPVFKQDPFSLHLLAAKEHIVNHASVLGNAPLCMLSMAINCYHKKCTDKPN